jgi:integrase/recombinase XerD
MKREAQLGLSESSQQALDQYRQVYLQFEDLSPVTTRNYLSNLRQFVTWYESSWGKGQEERSFTPQTVVSSLLIRYRDYLQIPLCLKLSTMNRMPMSLKRYFDWARNMRFIQSDPARPIKFVSNALEQRAQ